ncbi:MAG: DNA-binding transcriptional LysR family regulator [Cognaticolwellia sp.]|jgi:DNA-binding transcriptional LysR family regulator
MQLPVDPNLLLSLDTLLRLRNVTAAAAALGVTQSAMSQRLRKLREGLGDALLVPAGGALVLTHRAQSMQRPLRQALEALKAATRIGEDFDLAQAERTFVLASLDIGDLLVLPQAMQRCEAQAPGIRLRFRDLGLKDRAFHELVSGDLDLIVGGTSPPDLPGLRTRIIGAEPLVVIARKAHPHLSRGITLERWLECRHLVVGVGAGANALDEVLAHQGLSRDIAAWTGNMVPAPFTIAQTDLVMGMGKSLALRMAKLLDLEIHTHPLSPPPIQVRMTWHERAQQDPAHRWFRELAYTVTLDSFEALEPVGTQSSR